VLELISNGVFNVNTGAVVKTFNSI
jgi:hypothetical protein